MKSVLLSQILLACLFIGQSAFALDIGSYQGTYAGNGSDCEVKISIEQSDTNVSTVAFTVTNGDETATFREEKSSIDRALNSSAEISRRAEVIHRTAFIPVLGSGVLEVLQFQVWDQSIAFHAAPVKKGDLMLVSIENSDSTRIGKTGRSLTCTQLVKLN